MAKLKLRDADLLPCPFCGSAMMLRDALWPSEGDTDGILHAAPTDCPLPEFSISTADECVSVAAAWNKRALSPPEPTEGPLISDDELRTILIFKQGCSNWTGETVGEVCHEEMRGQGCGCLEVVRTLRTDIEASMRRAMPLQDGSKS